MCRYPAGVRDIYALDGACHSCNPGAVVRQVTPFSKNRRVVTIIDSDVAGGTGVGLVAMIEVVALMIGDIVQCYSARRYEAPRPVVRRGCSSKRGQPKSLYRPGSSVDLVSDLCARAHRICPGPARQHPARHGSEPIQPPLRPPPGGNRRHRPQCHRLSEEMPHEPRNFHRCAPPCPSA